MIQKYKLNMLPHAERTYRGYIPPKVNVSQYDKGLRTLVFDLYDGDQAYTLPENATAKIYGKKPDQNVFEYDMTIDASGEVPAVSIDLQEQMAVIAGMVECEVRIFSGSQTAGTANFLICVEPAPVGAEEAYSESEIPEIDNLLYGGTAGQVFTKTPTGAHWADLGTSSDFMRKSEYDPNDDGSVLKADHADDADTVDGHTVARNVLADEYTNSQIDTAVQAVSDAVSQLDGGVVKKVNNVAPVAGNVALAKSDIGLGNVDNTSDANKPISTATQAALDLKVDKEAGKGLSTNDFTTAEKEKLTGIAAGAEVNVQANWNESDQASDAFIQNKPSIPSKTSDLTNDSGFVTDAAMQSALDQKVDKVAGKGLSTEDFTSAEKTKLQGIEAGAQVNTVFGVKGGDESVYRTGNVNITKTNIGLGNVDNTSDLDKPISTATQTALDGKQATLTFDTTPTAGSTNPVTSDGIASVVSTLNTNLSGKQDTLTAGTAIDIDENNRISVDPSQLNARDIPAEGIGYKFAEGNPCVIYDGIAEDADDVTVDISPIQDLHGYDHPWPAGGGKNLCDPSQKTIEPARVYYYRTIGFQLHSGITYTFSVTDVTAAPLGIYIRKKSDGSNIAANYNAYAVTYTPSEDITVYFDVYADSSTLENIKAQVELGSTATAFEPYSNICPISGRTQVDVTRIGKNIWNDDVSLFNSEYWQKNGRVYKATVTSATAVYEWFDLKAGKEYVFSANFDEIVNDYGKLQIRDANDIVVSRVDGINNAGRYSGSYIPSADGQYRVLVGGNLTGSITISDIQLETGSAATAYEPYTAQTIATTLGQTVYGGALDVTTGTLTVRTANIASYNGETIGEPWWSSMDEYVAGTTPTIGAQVVYTLATPIELTVTPAQLTLLEGTNVLTTDGDNITLKYLGSDASNVQRVLNNTFESFAPVEQGIATSAHAVGSYISFNTQFCKVTQAISVGEIVQIGRNVQVTTVADELLAILAQIQV